MSIVLTHRVFPETFALLNPIASVIAPSAERLSPQELRAALTHAHAAMVFMPDRVDTAFLAAAPQLAIVAAALKGHDNIDIEACTARGVWVSFVPDLLTNPTAELTIGLMIALARHIRAADAFVRSGPYAGWTPQFYGQGIEGATVGLVGMGAIGRAIAKRLSGFDCRLLYYDEVELDLESTRRLGAERCALDRLLTSSDVVVLGLPLRDSTLHLMNATRLAQMKPGALLVNPARGSLVDEAAVAAALATGHLGGYAADVFELEDRSRADRPHSIAPALLAHPRCLFSAHIGSATVSARRAIEARAASNILDVLAGAPPRDAVNRLERAPHRKSIALEATPWRANA